MNSKPVEVFIVAGQSNAEGCNDIAKYNRDGQPFPDSL
jgi:hypothetical protein